MTQSKMNPNILAEQLDEILPANSGMTLDGDYDNPRLDVAKMLAAYSNEQLSDHSHSLIEERMMLTLDQAESKIWRRSSPGILLSVAVITLFAGCAAWFAVIGLPQPINETLNGFFVQEQSETVTATEELLITEITPSTVLTEIEATFTQMPSEQIPTATEIVPTAEATATEITIIPTPTRIPETAFVQVNAVNVRAQADPNSAILTTASLNQAVLIINVAADEAWSQVQLTDGTVGWINSDLLGDTQVTVQPANNGGNNNPPPNGGNGNGNAGNGNGGNGNAGNGNGNGGNGNGNGGNGGRGGRGGN